MTGGGSPMTHAPKRLMPWPKLSSMRRTTWNDLILSTFQSKDSWLFLTGETGLQASQYGLLSKNEQSIELIVDQIIGTRGWEKSWTKIMPFSVVT